jgi:hypothetical protein
MISLIVVGIGGWKHAQRQGDFMDNSNKEAQKK